MLILIMLILMPLIATVLKLCYDADANVLFNNPSAKVLQQQMGAIIAEAFKEGWRWCTFYSKQIYD